MLVGQLVCCSVGPSIGLSVRPSLFKIFVFYGYLMVKKIVVRKELKEAIEERKEGREEGRKGGITFRCFKSAKNRMFTS